MIQPEEDYECWASVLTISICQQDDFRALLPDFDRLMRSIIENDALEGVLADKTDLFIDSTAPETITALLNVGALFNVSTTSITNTLTMGLRLLTWAAAHEKFVLATKLLPILDEKQNFYMKNYSYTQSYRIAGDIKKEVGNDPKFATDLIQRIQSEDPPPLIDHFDIFWALYKEIVESYTYAKSINQVYTVSSIFLNYLTTMTDDQIRNVDNMKLDKSCMNFIETIDSFSITHDAMVHQILLFSDRLLMTTNIDKRIIGAKIIALSMKNRLSMEEWLNNTKLADYLVEQDLHPQLLETLEPVLGLIFQQKHLATFWEKTKNAHISQRPKMLTIVAKALKSFDYDAAEQFITTVTNDVVMPPEMIEFLFESAKSFVSDTKKFALAKKIVDIISGMLDKKETRQTAITILSNFGDYKSEYKWSTLQQYVVEHLTDLLQNVELQSEASIALKGFISKMSNYYLKEFKINIPEKVFAALDLPGSKPVLLYDIIIAYHIKISNGISLENLERMTSHGLSDSFMVSIQLLLEKIGIGIFLVGVADYFFQLIEEYDQTNATVVFVRFLLQYIQVYALYKDQIHFESYVTYHVTTLINPNYQIKTTALKGFNKLFNVLLLAQDDEVGKEASRSIMFLFSKMDCDKVSFEDLVKLLTNCLDQSTKTSEKAQQRSLSLIIQFIDKSEIGIHIEDYELIRHKRIPLQDHCINITVLTSDNDKLKFKISWSSSPSSLKERIATRLGIPLSYVSYLRNEQGVEILPKTSLYLAGVRDGSIVNAQVYKYHSIKVKKIPPTKLLYQEKLSSMIIKLVTQDSSKEFINTVTKLLNKLPDDPEIMEEMQDMESYLSSLLEKEFDFLHMYRLEALTYKIEEDAEIKNSFIEFKGTKFIISQFAAWDGVYFDDLFYYMSILRSIGIQSIVMSDDDLEIIATTLLKILNIECPDKSIYTIAAQLLASIIKKNVEKIKEIIESNLDFLEIAISKASSNTWKYLRSAIVYLDKSKKLFNMCLRHINSGKTENNFIEIFSIVVYGINSEEKEDCLIVLDNCIKLIPKSTDTSKIGLCKIVSSILSSELELKNQYKEYALDLIKLAFSTENNEAQGNLFKLITDLVNNDYDEQSLQYMQDTVSIRCDRWNYKPSSFSQSELGYLGLRNLSSTCYMNSIFQQLFFTIPFRYSILTKEFEDEAFRNFRFLFAEMIMSNKKFCDTQPFCSTWKGWYKKLINPREQQDAFEFLQMILDQLPEDINSIFRGTIKHTIEGTTEEFHSFNIEPFFIVPLDIKGFNNVCESFNSFIDNEMFTDYSVGDHKIDARKFARIEKCPDVLVLQLKRFEYNIINFERIKINDKYEFNQQLNIKDYCIDNTEDVKYQLKGVVLHSGSVQGGHYTSLIKLEDKWIKFNDVEVSELPETQFETETFGGSTSSSYQAEYDSGASAYLLFYTKVDAVEKNTQLKYDEKIDFLEVIPKEIQDKIIQDNNYNTKFQAVFNENTFNFILSSDNTPLIVKYFIHIYCHSGLNSYKKMMDDKLHAIVKTDTDWIVNYMIEQYELFEEIFLNCSNIDALNILTQFLGTVISITEAKATYGFVIKLFDSMKTAIATSYKQTTQLSKIIYSFIKNGPTFTQLCVENNWMSLFTDLLVLVYSSTRSQMFLQNINLQFIFQSMNTLVKYLPIFDEVPTLMSYASMILQSEFHASNFTEFLSTLTSVGIIDFSTLISAITSNKKEILENEAIFDIFLRALLQAKTPEDVDNLISKICNKTAHKSAGEMLVTRFIVLMKNGRSDVRDLLINNGQLIAKFLTLNDKVARKAAEKLVYKIFSQVKKVKHNKGYKCKQTMVYKTPRSKIITPEDREAMLMIYQALVAYSEFIIENIGNFYETGIEDEFKKTKEVGECQYYLVQYSNILYFFIKRLDLYNEDSFNLLMKLFNAANTLELSVDINKLSFVEILLRFSPEMYQDHFQTLFDSCMANVTEGAAAIMNIASFLRPMTKISNDLYEYVMNSPVIDILIKNLDKCYLYDIKSINITFLKVLDERKDSLVTVSVVAKLLKGITSETLSYYGKEFVKLVSTFINSLPDDVVQYLGKLSISAIKQDEYGRDVVNICRYDTGFYIQILNIIINANINIDLKLNERDIKTMLSVISHHDNDVTMAVQSILANLCRSSPQSIEQLLEMLYNELYEVKHMYLMKPYAEIISSLIFQNPRITKQYLIVNYTNLHNFAGKHINFFYTELQKYIDANDEENIDWFKAIILHLLTNETNLFKQSTEDFFLRYLPNMNIDLMRRACQVFIRNCCDRKEEIMHAAIYKLYIVCTCFPALLYEVRREFPDEIYIGYNNRVHGSNHATKLNTAIGYIRGNDIPFTRNIYNRFDDTIYTDSDD